MPHVANSERTAEFGSSGAIEVCSGVPFILSGTHFKVSAFRVMCANRTSECLAVHIGGFRTNPVTPCLVRIHSGCITGEVFGSDLCDCRWQLHHALKLISATGNGVVVYCPEHEGRGLGLVQKFRSFKLMARGFSTFEAFKRLGLPVDRRDYTPAIVVLKQFGIRIVRMITNNPAKIAALRSAGFEVCERISTVMDTNDPQLRSYLLSKASAGHLMGYRGLE
jgi:GTP cyclohydrolase II